MEELKSLDQVTVVRRAPYWARYRDKDFLKVWFLALVWLLALVFIITGTWGFTFVTGVVVAYMVVFTADLLDLHWKNIWEKKTAVVVDIKKE